MAKYVNYQCQSTSAYHDYEELKGVPTEIYSEIFLNQKIIKPMRPESKQQASFVFSSGPKAQGNVLFVFSFDLAFCEL